MNKDRIMEWLTIALLAPMPVIAAVVITAIIVLVAAQASVLLYRWLL